ncbi:MAG: hypothetical protein PUP90_22460 [Nostoc sp. S4]|nr:hypothetical protein [Nostoc sp. S4]
MLANCNRWIMLPMLVLAVQRRFTIDAPATCGDILDQALTTPPVIIEAIVDPYEPLLPPKITLNQAAKLAQS